MDLNGFTAFMLSLNDHLRNQLDIIIFFVY